MKDHALIEELLWARALDAIEPGDERRLAAAMDEHGKCDECRRLERDAAEVVARLALAVDPVAVPKELEERTVALATRTRPAARAAPPAAPPRLPAARGLRPLLAAAAALVLFIAGWLGGSLARAPETIRIPVDARVVAFEHDGDATLALVYRPGEEGLYLVGSDLPRPAAGRSYEFWLFRGETPVRAGCFRPAGSGTVYEFVEARIGDASLAAVTEEPSSCPPAPTSDPLFTATL
jgi:hypothetical protein